MENIIGGLYGFGSRHGSLVFLLLMASKRTPRCNTAPWIYPSVLLLYSVAGSFFYQPLWQRVKDMTIRDVATVSIGGVAFDSEKLFSAALASVWLELLFWATQLLVYTVVSSPEHFARLEIKKKHVSYPNSELLRKCVEDLAVGHAVRPILLWGSMYLFDLRGIDFSVGSFPSLPTMLWHAFISVQVDDFLFYWVHRWMHENRWVYKTIHKQHHEFHYAHPLATEYAHPVEDMLNLLATVAGPLLLKSHGVVLIGYTGLKLWQSIDAHSGLSLPFPLSPWNILFPCMDCSLAHDFHHSNNKGNYGGYFIFWDWLCGTDTAYRRHQDKRIQQKQ